MKSIIENSQLCVSALDSIRNWRCGTLIVAPEAFRTAHEVCRTIMQGFLDNNPRFLNEYSLVELHERFGIQILIKPIEKYEWLFIDQGGEIHYSKGDGTPTFNNQNA